MQPELKRVRPSSLGMARYCARAPWLSAKYNESHVATRLGSAVDGQVTALIRGDDIEEDIFPETEIVIAWLGENFPSTEWEYHAQTPVELLDPETGEVLTKGTPDLLCVHRTEPRISVIDYKKRGQMFSGHLPPPEENLQQLAYLAAAWLKLSKERTIRQGDITLCCWDDRGITAPKSDPINEEGLWGIINTIRAIPPMDVSVQPEASIGEHCDHCWGRMHCDAHLLPLAVAAKAGLPEPFAEFAGQELTTDLVVKALTWLDGADRILREAKKIRDMIEDNVDAFVKQNGPVTVGDLCYGPVEVKGRRGGATVKTLEEMGLTNLIREGKISIKCKYYKAPG